MATNLASEIHAFLNVLTAESDRGLVLAGCAFLDDSLETLLSAAFLDKPKHVQALLSIDRPLGSFSSRIKIAYLLGLLEDGEYRDLELIRTIRNNSAHTHGKVDFSHPPHKDRIAELSGPTEVEGLFNKFMNESFTEHGRTPRNQLLVTISFLCVWLNFRAKTVSKPTPPNHSGIKKDSFRIAKEIQ